MGCQAAIHQRKIQLTEESSGGTTLSEVMKKALNFDFNKYKKEGELTFEARFQQKTTNGLGNLIFPAAAEVIILQFRKFMAVLAFDMLIRKDFKFTGVNILFNEEFTCSKINHELYFTHILVPPLIIDSVWSSLILSSKVYEEFCYELCGAFIERINYNITGLILTNGVNSCNTLIKMIDESFKKYHPLWDIHIYNNSEYIFKYNLSLQKTKLAQVLSKINKMVMDFNFDSDSNINQEILEACNTLYEEIFYYNSNMFASCEEDTFAIINEALDDKTKKWPEFFKNLLDLRLHEELLQSFMKRYCVSKTDSILIMIEYFKFLTIVKLKGDGYTPSPWVDEFWHHHMSSDTRHYRNFCVSLFGEKVDHSECDPPSILSLDKLSQARKEVEKTKHAYEEIFLVSPPESIWPNMEIADPTLYPTFLNINIFRIFICKCNILASNKLNKSEEISDKQLLISEYLQIPQSKPMTEIPSWISKYQEAPLMNHNILHPQSLIYFPNYDINKDNFESTALSNKDMLFMPSSYDGRVEFLEDLVPIHQRDFNCKS